MKSEILHTSLTVPERDDFALMPRLRTAVVCLDCETLFPRVLTLCPACSGDQSFPLVNWIEMPRWEDFLE